MRFQTKHSTMWYQIWFIDWHQIHSISSGFLLDQWGTELPVVKSIEKFCRYFFMSRYITYLSVKIDRSLDGSLTWGYLDNYCCRDLQLLHLPLDPTGLSLTPFQPPISHPDQKMWFIFWSSIESRSYGLVWVGLIYEILYRKMNWLVSLVSYLTNGFEKFWLKIN